MWVPRWERREQFVGWVVTDAWSSIDHFDRQGVTISLGIDPAMNLDLSSDTAVGHGVVQEVSEGVLDPCPVDPDDGIGHIEFDDHPALANKGVHASND